MVRSQLAMDGITKGAMKVKVAELRGEESKHILTLWRH